MLCGSGVLVFGGAVGGCGIDELRTNCRYYVGGRGLGSEEGGVEMVPLLWLFNWDLGWFAMFTIIFGRSRFRDRLA